MQNYEVAAIIASSLSGLYERYVQTLPNNRFKKHCTFTSSKFGLAALLLHRERKEWMQGSKGRVNLL